MRRRKNRGSSRFLKFLALAFFVTLFSLLHAWQRAQLVREGYRMNSKEQMISQLLKRGAVLKLDASTLKSPQRIEKISREKLGLVEPDNEKYVYLKLHF